MPLGQRIVCVIRTEQHKHNTQQPTVSDPEFACTGEMIDNKIPGVNSFAGTACIVLGPNHLLITFIILASLLVAMI
jgi:hypothetical protein